MGISFGLEGPAADAMIIDVTKLDERKGVYSLMYWSFNLAFSLGGIDGAFMFENHLFIPLLILTFSSIVSNILVIFFIKETFKPKISHPVKRKNVLKDMFQSYKEVARDNLFLLFVLAGLLIQSLENQLENYIGVR
jgi:MFS transporter, DHA1 family, multidrug resistance protein B